MIVSNNHDYDSMQSYYRDKLYISVLSKEVNMIFVKVKVTVKVCTTKIITVIHNKFYQWS